ncbi:hypothetical protein [Gloeobacter violaceus]|uniref:Gll0026 protein n=1 Tax=Gloeobacter violaceus (strain ATCC 29082 / PCC 7421) TaxID=251221 RepID=Q7NPM9_GLOVI|nr:hypothetical protein [Gloeobacter violaceus]BAC87967.1 gll0026 [Gloeobacter violaceus PCC 7421]
MSAPVLTTATAIEERAGLGADDGIDWAGLGAPYTRLERSFVARSIGGMAVQVQVAGHKAPPLVLESCPANHTNFVLGEMVLFTGLEQNPGPIVLVLSEPVWGAGAQIQPDYPGAFTGVLEAFDDQDRPVASVRRAGLSTTACDGSAIFVGFHCLQVPVVRLVFAVEAAGGPYALAVNRLDLRHTRA